MKWIKANSDNKPKKYPVCGKFINPMGSYSFGDIISPIDLCEFDFWLDESTPLEKTYTEEERDKFAIAFFIDMVNKYKMEYVRLMGWHQANGMSPDEYFSNQELLDLYKGDLELEK